MPCLRIVLGLVAAFTALLMVYGRPASAETAQQLVFTTTHFPPFTDQNGPTDKPGFINELVAEAFRRAGHTARIDIYPWARAQSLAREGLVTGTFISTVTAERKKLFYYSDSFNRLTAGFFSLPERHIGGLTRIEQARGFRVIANRGYSLSRLLHETGINHFKVSSEDQGLRMLEYGRADLYLAYLRPICRVKKEAGIATPLKFHRVQDYPYYLILHKQWPQAKELIRAFDEAISNMRRDGSYARIMARYQSAPDCADYAR